MSFQKLGRFGLLASIVFVAGCVGETDTRAPSGSEQESQQMCPMIYDPVCAERDGMRKTFGNECQAKADNYRVVSRGECKQRSGNSGAAQPQQQVDGGEKTAICTREYRPVCAQKGSEDRSFANRCTAESAGYRVLRDGQCQ
ncbi:Kazal-type serine protease inhibitor family protein [Brucellaceae bacterium D45D]